MLNLPQALSNSLPTCIPLPIIVKPFNATLNNTSGVPPYYMIAFATGGTPSTTLIGKNNRTLSWTVTEPVGESTWTLLNKNELTDNRSSIDAKCGRFDR